jgi:hypothetical protein
MSEFRRAAERWAEALGLQMTIVDEQVRADVQREAEAALAIGAGLAEAEQLRRLRRELCPKHEPWPPNRGMRVWTPSCPGCAPWALPDDPRHPDWPAMARARRERFAIGSGA